ncbi:hypothetical protein ACFU96_02235 [Streptomyces sp. NPDC057620]|uniref:hypothetical protein n=1 Tax=Streptomyces sp. NPDC057620 TaxID=3346185 RepID=UPI0036CFE1B1
MNQDEESDTALADFIGFEGDLYDVIDTLPNSCQRRRSIMTTAMMMIMTTMVPRPMYTGLPLCRKRGTRWCRRSRVPPPGPFIPFM